MLDRARAGAERARGRRRVERRRSRRPEPGAERLAQIEARLAELREAEKLFLRTRDELAARSEAVAARERLVAQKERELDDREDGAASEWGPNELSEMEARLRRLEQQHARRADRQLRRRPAQAAAGREAPAAAGLRRRRATLSVSGALAQLGERRLCKAEVAGSIPARSITTTIHGTRHVWLPLDTSVIWPQ